MNQTQFLEEVKKADIPSKIETETPLNAIFANLNDKIKEINIAVERLTAKIKDISEESKPQQTQSSGTNEASNNVFARFSFIASAMDNIEARINNITNNIILY